MPQSRNRYKHHQQVQAHHTPDKPKRSVAAVLAVLIAIFGLAIAYFTRGDDAVWLITGAIAGALIGYFVGFSIDKSLKKDR